MTDPMRSATPSRNSFRKAEIYPFLEALIAKKEQEIADIEQMVQRYEKRRIMEEQAYRSMSTLKRLLSGKKPDHHLAVEYFLAVKKPMEKARMLRQEVDHAKKLLYESVPSGFVQVTEGRTD